MRWLHVAAVALVACRVSDLVDNPQSGARLQFSTQPTTVDYGEVISPPVKVSVFDPDGRTDTTFNDPITLSLAANPSGAALLGTTTVTAESGVATFADLQVDKPGRGYVLQASAVEHPMAVSAPFEVVADAPLPQATRLAFVVPPSNVQAGSAIAPAVQVAAQDAAGTTITSYSGTITIAVGTNPGGGTLSGTTSAVAANGIATFANVRISAAGNGYTLTAAASGLSGATSAAFDVTAQPPPPPPPATQLAFTVQPSTSDTGSTITPAVQVAARDASGNLVVGYSGPITIAIGTNPSSGTLVGTMSVAAVGGVAVFGNLRINRAGSGYTLRATASGLTAATSAPFNITAPPPPPPPTATQLAFTVQPSTTEAGQDITPAVKVAARDASGNVVTGYTGTITIAIGSNPGGGTLSGTMSSVAGSGVATFSGLRIDRAGNGYTLTAAASGLTGATSAAFNITAPPPPPPPTATQLAFTVQPSTTEAGEDISPAVRVAARDASGNIVSGYTGAITIAIGSNPGGGTLSGTTSSVASSGVATFSGLRIDRAGNGYTLTAAASGLSGATSASFNITAPPPPPPPPATRLAFVAQPSTTEAGATISPPIQVAARDDAGNIVTSFAGTISLAIGSNPGSGTLGGTTSATAVNGVATFGNVRIDRAGNGYTLTAGSAGLSGATSASFNITAPPPPPPPPPPVATGLRFIVQPSNTGVNQPISPAVQIMAVDANGNQVTGFTGAITVDLAPNLLGATAFGTLTVNAVNGIAAFSNIRINLVGIDFRLRAMFAGQTPIETSNAFIVLL